ncbi:MAG TPA: hypothetical protein VNW97_07000 [Candidatus Saccharimonadales bacterium]|jgi:hypothetical protein|nr:hypothetical protein [Candidatus Saccharimonadales bacterium]
MELAKLTLEYVKAITWPLIAVISIFVFRKSIEALISRITKVDVLGVSAELGEVLKNQAVPKALTTAHATPNDKKGAGPDLEFAVSTGGYSNDYRAIFLVIGIANKGSVDDQVVEWKLHFPSMDVELEPAAAPANLVPGVPWWPSPLVKIHANEFVQGSLFFRGRKILLDELPQEPLSGRLTARTLHGKELSHDVVVYRLSTLRANPALDR